MAALELLLAGFAAFFALEQFLHWRHCHHEFPDRARQPLTYLVLVGDGLHNLLGGLAVGGAFIADIRLGIGAWLAAASHEVPQELGDFGVLVHGGWEKRRALIFNALSALTFLMGGLLAYGASLASGCLLPAAIRGRQLSLYRGFRSGPGGEEGSGPAGEPAPLRMPGRRDGPALSPAGRPGRDVATLHGGRCPLPSGFPRSRRAGRFFREVPWAAS